LLTRNESSAVDMKDHLGVLITARGQRRRKPRRPDFHRHNIFVASQWPLVNIALRRLDDYEALLLLFRCQRQWCSDLHLRHVP